MYLRNSVALITGGAQGLGKGFARAVLEAGGKVSLLDLKEDVGRNTANEFNHQYGSNSSLFIKCDVCSDKEVKTAFQQTWDKFGRLDLVVNNAGITSFNGNASSTHENWQRTIDVNLTAVMRCCYVAAEYMKQGGHVINISSAAGLTSVPFDPAYAASKHGVVGLSRSLSETWEPLSIRVNCLCPSFADTDIIKTGLGDHTSARWFKAALNQLGVMSVDNVVKAFTQLLQETGKTGGVLTVTPMGIKYKFNPRTMKVNSKL